MILLSSENKAQVDEIVSTNYKAGKWWEVFITYPRYSGDRVPASKEAASL